MSTGDASKKAAAKPARAVSDPVSVTSADVRKRVLLALLALIVVAGVILVWSTSGDEEPPSEAANSVAATSTGATISSSPAPGTETSAAPTSESGAGGEPVELDPVPLDENAPFGDQVSAELVDLSAVQAEGQGVGEISGPALQVTVRLVNGTSQPLSIDAVTVSLYFGSDRTPAPPISDGTVPFRGTLEASESAEGVYTFSIGEDDRDNVSVTVSHSPASSTVVFNGPVG